MSHLDVSLFIYWFQCLYTLYNQRKNGSDPTLEKVGNVQPKTLKISSFENLPWCNKTEKSQKFT